MREEFLRKVLRRFNLKNMATFTSNSYLLFFYHISNVMKINYRSVTMTHIRLKSPEIPLMERIFPMRKTDFYRFRGGFPVARIPDGHAMMASLDCSKVRVRPMHGTQNSRGS